VSSRRSQQLDTDAATSARLSRIRQKSTAPELAVGEILRSLGFYYRLTNRDLPASPDFANRRRRWAIFVHGCFWHAHAGCPRATVPKRNTDFWKAKFSANKKRDATTLKALRAQGYDAVVIWECELRDAPVVVLERLKTLQTVVTTRTAV